MSVSIGGSITIDLRDLGQLPEDDAECRQFFLQVIGEECWQKVNGIRLMAASGTDAARRAGPPAQELESRGVTIGVTITGTF